jgi:uncharacterized protein
MQLRHETDRLLVRLDRGEELVESLLAVAADEQLESALVLGIGALEEIELGYYALGERRYLRRRFPGIHELLSLSGNLAQLDGKPFLHAHVVLGNRDFSVLGGHLFRGRVAVVVEAMLFPGEQAIGRAMDEGVGLNLWRL